MMEFLKADREERKAAQVKADADRVQMQERMEADRKADKEEKKAHRRELKEMMEKIMNANHVETTACQGMEARPEEEVPTSPDRKPETAQKEEVPAEIATVIPVGEQKKERRRNRKLAAERRRQMKERNQDGCQRRLAAARRGMSHRAEMTRKMQADKKMPRRATVARRMRDIFRPNTSRCAKVARQIRENDRKVPGRPRIAWHQRSVVRRNCTMTVIERATQRAGLLRKIFTDAP
jgi:hypothetical protein